jgi:hypothetical protein
MRFRTAQVVAAVVALAMGAWVWVASTQAIGRLGGEPPGSVLLGSLLGVVAAVVTYALLHEGPRGVPLLLRVRGRRGRR